MAAPIRIMVFIIGDVFALIGVAGLFQPEALACRLEMVVSSGEGAGSIRASTGAQYAAFGGVGRYHCVEARRRGRRVGRP